LGVVNLRGLHWVILAALLLPTASAAVSEKLVFQGNETPPTYGFDLSDSPDTVTCPDPYDGEDCIFIDRASWSSDLLAKALANDKHAYRVRFWLYAEADDLQSVFRVTFSFKPGPATGEAVGDGDHLGAFGDSVQAIFEENSVGWDIHLAEVTEETLQELGVGVETRDSSQWRAYDFIVNTDTQQVKLQNEQGTTLVAAPLRNHEGSPIYSQWYRGHGGNWYGAAQTYLRLGGDSTRIYDQDPRPPVISNLTQNPRQVKPDESVQVTATIRDDWGQATAVLRSWVNDASQADVAMTRQGTTYTATIPGHALDAEVDYYVEATAVSGLKARSDTIRYVVGSNEDPENLGGGSTTATSSRVLGAVAVGLAIFVVGIILFLVLRQDPNSKRLAGPILVAATILAGIAILVILNLAAIAEALASPFLWPILLAAGALTAAFLHFRHREGQP
jgi:hypothetical protein